MNRIFGVVAVVIVGALAGACGGAADQKEAANPGGAAQGDVCPTVSPGPPPTCPDSCAWNGTECRQKGPIVVFDRPAPTSTATSTIVQPPIQPAPSTP